MQPLRIKGGFKLQEEKKTTSLINKKKSVFAKLYKRKGTQKGPTKYKKLY